MRSAASGASTCGAGGDERARGRSAWATGRYHPFEFAIRERVLPPPGTTGFGPWRPLIDDLADILSSRLQIGKWQGISRGQRPGRTSLHIRDRSEQDGREAFASEGIVEMAGPLDSPVDGGLRLAECDALLLGLDDCQGDEPSAGIPEIAVVPRGAEDWQGQSDRRSPHVKAVVFEGDAPSTWLPCFHRRDTAGLAAFLEARWLERVPAMRGLVLAGGKSARMGVDKAELRYGRRTQAIELVEMLSRFCADVLVSRAPGQAMPSGIPRDQVLEDRYLDFGPLGGILTAQDRDPGMAWFAVGCDLPFLDEGVLERLVAARAPLRNATCFLDSERGLPEPVCAIWEPKSRLRSLQLLALGRRCPRKILIESRIGSLPAPEGRLFNANTPEERERSVLGLAGVQALEAGGSGARTTLGAAGDGASRGRDDSMRRHEAVHRKDADGGVNEVRQGRGR